MMIGAPGASIRALALDAYGGAIVHGDGAIDFVDGAHDV